MIEVKTLSTEDAQNVIQAVLDHIKKIGHRGCGIVVVDKNGDIIAGLRTSGMHERYFRAAHRKAYTAAVMERDTSAVMEFWNGQQAAGMRGPSDWNDPMLTSLHGGICVTYKGEIVGGIGAAGGSGGEANSPTKRTVPAPTGASPKPASLPWVRATLAAPAAANELRIGEMRWLS
jgi:uncharacterized protein GlcG (DUF336 family)